MHIMNKIGVTLFVALVSTPSWSSTFAEETTTQPNTTTSVPASEFAEETTAEANTATSVPANSDWKLIADKLHPIASSVCDRLAATTERGKEIDSETWGLNFNHGMLVNRMKKDRTPGLYDVIKTHTEQIKKLETEKVSAKQQTTTINSEFGTVLTSWVKNEAKPHIDTFMQTNDLASVIGVVYLIRSTFQEIQEIFQICGLYITEPMNTAWDATKDSLKDIKSELNAKLYQTVCKGIATEEELGKYGESDWHQYSREPNSFSQYFTKISKNAESMAAVLGAKMGQTRDAKQPEHIANSQKTLLSYFPKENAELEKAFNNA